MVLQEGAIPDFVRGHDIDNVTLDIIENALKNIRHEMDRVLVTTAVSPVIREQADEFPLIADKKGRMIVGQFGSPVDTVLENSPYKLEDLKDVGGSTAGSIPIDARSIFEEGVRMPPEKLYDGGRLNDEDLRFFCHNSRTPRETRADVMAIAAGTAAGAQRVKDICDRFGKDTYLEACDALLDWTGTGDQVPGPVNFLLNKEMFQMFAGVFLISAVDPTILFNDGYADIIKVNIPDGTVLRPKEPAPLSNRLVVMARQFDVLGAVYAKAIGFNVSGSYGTSPNFVYSGVKKDGEPFQTMEILYGGIPAIPGKDGLDGHSWWPEFMAVPAEYMETYYPMIVDEYSVRRDSCGAGQFRGGCGIRKVYRFLADGAITYQDDRAATFPYGVAGGKPGASSKKTLRRAGGEAVALPSKVRDVPVYEGDRLVFETAGAGGVGDPLERDPEAVAKDLRWNLISPEAAEAEYGVVVINGSVDATATASRRGQISETRAEPPGFDHGDLPPLEDQRRAVAETRRRFNEWLSGELGAA